MNRRGFLRAAAAGAAGALAERLPGAAARGGAALGSGPAARDGTAGPAPARRRPNVVLILADDMGFSDFGCYGSEIATPNLDGLAARGVRFSQFYNAARCCPTRASLLTGLYPHQAGVGMMRADEGERGYQGQLNDACVTVAEVLGGAGYRTCLSGKWHVGRAPMARGFERAFEFREGATSYFRPEDLFEDGKPFTAGEGFYLTDAISDRAAGFAREYAGRAEPLLLYVAYTAPHWPLHAPPEEIEKYRGKYLRGWDELRERRHARQVEMGLVDRRWRLAPRDPQCPAWADAAGRDDWDLRMAVYAAQIDRMDQGIGRILQALRQAGAETDTLVAFLSDNGGCHVRPDRGKPGAAVGTADSYTGYDRSWANASNTPFRWFKQYTHEGGIASPLIAAWPGVIPAAGAITHQVGHVIDLAATCLEAAGAAYPEAFNGRAVTPLEGKSLVPVLAGRERAGHDALFWEHTGNRAVRRGNWKLVSTRHANQWELYDLAADRTELTDLAARDAGRVKELADLYEAWGRRCHVYPKPAGRKKQA